MTSQERHILIQQAMQAFNPHYRESIQQVFAAANIEGRDWFYSYLAYGLEPEPLTAVTLHQMTPYGSIKKQAEWLAQTAEKGYLEAIDKGAYRLTDTGRGPVEAFFASARKAMDLLAPLPDKKMVRLADLLARIVAVTEAADPPALKTHFAVCRRTDPGVEATPASKIDQYLTDLLRYRDDAHLAAWADLGVDGRTWDAFTYVWREQAHTASALAKTLANRNYTEDDYAASLAELVERGWIEEVDGAYQVTENGRKLRQEAEETTDRYYFIGWSALTDKERVELDKLLTKMRDRLQEMAADKATAAAKDLYPLVGEISGSIFKLTRPVMNPLFEEMGLAERGLAFMLIQAGYFASEPVSTKRIQVRSPYANPANWVNLLNKVTEKGLMVGVGKEEYALTEDGRAALKKFLKAFRGHLDTIELEVDTDRLAELLSRIIHASLNAPEPPGNWAIQHSRNIAPDDDSGAFGKIDQYLDDLNAFRDDAHNAAFAPLDIAGPGWELFSQLWRDEVHTPAEMAEKMNFRGHDEAFYAAAMDDLVARGWVQAKGDGFVLTEDGRAIRDAAELQTDRYFYAPWLALNQAELGELRDLMTALKKELAPLAEAAATPA